MDFATVCTGIGAPEVAAKPLGWNPLWFSEIEPFPCRLLKHYYPHIPNLGDMLLLRQNEKFQSSAIDLLAGGTPCQSFSVAGLRGGLADSRGNLALEFCRLLIAKKPQWFVWENVPGVFSSRTGSDRDFGNILRAFRECGYSCAYRVLDAQYFGVPQRRRRVFVVGYFGNDWRPSAAVLFEQNGGDRDIKAGGKAREEITRSLTGRPYSDRPDDGNLIIGTLNAGMGKRRGSGMDPELLVANTLRAEQGNGSADNETLIPWPKQVVDPLNASFGEKQGIDDQHIKAGAGHFVPCFWDGTQTSQTLDAVLYKGQTMPEKNRFPAVIFNHKNSAASSMAVDEISPTLSSTKEPAVLYSQNGLMVRRLTPLECERLQGFPDHYTAIPGAKDSPRYKALGNSMAVPVMHWIFSRIDAIDKFLKQSK
jgi:DNA (cytosine-5)-methyltransferase 1